LLVVRADRVAGRPPGLWGGEGERGGGCPAPLAVIRLAGLAVGVHFMPFISFVVKPHAVESVAVDSRTKGSPWDL
jgi:hypothetical protein